MRKSKNRALSLQAHLFQGYVTASFDLDLKGCETAYVDSGNREGAALFQVCASR